MRTLERADVNKATEEDMFGWSPQGEPGHRVPANREPIFRLAWSAFPDVSWGEWAHGLAGAGPSTPTSPSTPAFPSAAASPQSPTFAPRAVPDERVHLGGGTILTVLGGLLPQDPTGIHVFNLPAYAPTTANPSANTGNLPAPVRQALKDSVRPLEHNLYPTAAPPEDFLLLPRNSPYGGMAFDPTAILITTGSDPTLPVLAAPHSARGTEAWSFPPTSHTPPRSLQLPPALAWTGPGTCTSSRILTLPTLSHQRLLHQFNADPITTHVPFLGGKATPLRRRNATGSPALEGSSRPRILVSLHVDLCVRFWDVSEGLLGEGGLHEDFPRALGHLDVRLRDILRDPMAKELEASRILRDRPWELEIDRVDLATDTLELAVTLSTGEVVVLR